MHVPAIAIPARLQSSRFPRKLLAPLAGKPVLQHVVEQAQQLEQPTVYVVTDSDEIAQQAHRWGVSVLMTPSDCPNGTARIAHALAGIEADFILNIQGDEPFAPLQTLRRMLDQANHTDADILTPIRPIASAQELDNPNIVKAVCTAEGRALYFSRSAVPFCRDVPTEAWPNENIHYAHLGIYGYKRHVLENYPKLKPTKLENAEKLEQLRFLEYGYTIQTVKTEHATAGIDTPEDLRRAEEYLQGHLNR